MQFLIIRKSFLELENHSEMSKNFYRNIKCRSF